MLRLPRWKKSGPSACADREPRRRGASERRKQAEARSDRTQIQGPAQRAAGPLHTPERVRRGPTAAARRRGRVDRAPRVPRAGGPAGDGAGHGRHPPEDRPETQPVERRRRGQALAGDGRGQQARGPRQDAGPTGRVPPVGPRYPRAPETRDVVFRMALAAAVPTRTSGRSRPRSGRIFRSSSARTLWLWHGTKWSRRIVGTGPTISCGRWRRAVRRPRAAVRART